MVWSDKRETGIFFSFLFIWLKKPEERRKRCRYETDQKKTAGKKAIMKGERALGKKLEEKMDGGCDGFCSVLHYALADGSFCSIRR